ncbi:hypothetical protein Agub_g3925, partial [Astrephomene gubernaculifera]
TYYHSYSYLNLNTHRPCCAVIQSYILMSAAALPAAKAAQGFASRKHACNSLLVNYKSASCHGQRRQVFARAAAAASQQPSSNPKPGKCWLVGAGPGPADYLTLKAVRLLESADVIIYDDLGSQDALSFARPGAQLLYVGKRGGREGSAAQYQIDALLVEQCGRGHQVVRLKGGCPSVFSRVASEIAALSQAGIEFELVPGVSSALAAPLMAGFPLTHVTHAPSFTVVSAHAPASTDWA